MVIANPCSNEVLGFHPEILVRRVLSQSNLSTSLCAGRILSCEDFILTLVPHVLAKRLTRSATEISRPDPAL